MMLSTKEEILDKLKQVKPLLEEKYSLTELALFGSYARNEQTEESDIDIMVQFAKPSFRNLCNTADTLDELFKGKEVQIVSKGAIKPNYFEYVKPDLLYA
jgi:uncharacterized protein